MTNCTQESFQFPVLKRRIVEASFQGGDITSDGGVLLLQQVDRLLEAVARILDDPRRQASIDQNSLSLLRQRAYAPVSIHKLPLNHVRVSPENSTRFSWVEVAVFQEHTPAGGNRAVTLRTR